MTEFESRSRQKERSPNAYFHPSGRAKVRRG